MKNSLRICFILVFLQTHVFGQTQNLRMINAQRTIEYLESAPGKATTAIRNVDVQLVYWSDTDKGNKDQTISFVVASATAAPDAKPTIYIAPITIEGKKFSKEPDTVTYTIPITIAAVPTTAPEFFTIGLQVGGTTQDASAGGSVGVAIQKDPVVEKTRPTPVGFTYLNAVNFDFENSSGAAYVGHLNIFKPSIGRGISRKRKETAFLNAFGMNLGIMKINYSKGGDSINNSYNYAENTLINPLDSIKVGTHFYRQYNNITNVSKNTSWSFYFQPTLNLLYRDGFKLLLHSHFEFFIDTWNTSTTIRNIKQITDSITAYTSDSVIHNIQPDNKFEKSLTDLVTLNASDTKLSFYYGAGLTLYTDIWDGATLFIQPTIGGATAYLSPKGIISEDNPNKSIKTEDSKAWFHLTRFELRQELTSTLQAVVGVNVRGRFGDDPTYAAYIGINLGLNGIRALFHD